MRTSLKVAFASLVVSLLTLSASAQGRIATVQLGKVFDGYWKTKQAEAALKDRAADLEKEHKNMTEDWKKQNEEYQKILADANDQAVSAEERDKRKQNAETKLKAIKELQETIAQFERQARVTIDDQRQRVRGKLLGEIKDVIQSHSKRAGYSFVLDIGADSAKNTPVILYSSGDYDITTAVLEQLNAAAPADALKDAEVKAEESKDKEKP